MAYSRVGLIERLEVFNDYEEIVVALRELSPTYSSSADYYMREAAIHIEGLTDLAQMMAKELAKSAK